MTEPSTAGMRKAVLDDDQRDIGVPMLLHTAASLARDVDPGRFSTAGYLHQAALGRRLLETGDLDGEPTGAHLLSLNFHEIPPACRDEAADRVRRAAALGEPYDPDDGIDGLRVMVAFYDADRDTGLFAARLCRELGVRAYFFPVDATTLETGPRLTDDDLATIAEHHELCFHTATHRSAREITPANQEREVAAPIERLTRAAGRPPRLAAWRGGARFDAGTLGDQLVRDLGVRHLVSNWSIEPVG
jgi:hypothetical protein